MSSAASATENGNGPASLTCSVIVCTRNRPSDLDRCLAALHKLEYSPSEILVVDNAPVDGRGREVALRWGARHTVSPVAGLSRARNHGAQLAAGDVVAYLDDDSIATPSWLGELISEFGDPRVMAVTGQTLPLSVETEAERIMAAISAQGTDRDRRWAVDRSTPDWFAMANFGGIGDGGNMAFRRALFDGWPGFLEFLGRGAPVHGGEEHFAFFSLIHAGHKVVYTPHAVTLHPMPRTLPVLCSRQLDALSTSTAYMSFLLVEASSYRSSVLNYMFRYLRRAPRPWRSRRAKLGLHVLPWWRVMAALLAGPWIYVRAVWLAGGRLTRTAERFPRLESRAENSRSCSFLPPDRQRLSANQLADRI